MDWHELHKTRVVDLREMMKEHLPDVTGITQMKKDQLIELLADALEIKRPHKKIEAGLGKRAMKARIRELKGSRAAAVAAGDKTTLHRSRREIHRLKRRLRRLASLAS